MSDDDSCGHTNVRGPHAMGADHAGAFCSDCGERVPCPHPPHKRIQRRPLGGPIGEIKCGWCGDVVG